VTTQKQPETAPQPAATEPATRQEIKFFGSGALRQTGNLFALAASVIRLTFKRPFQARELTEQFWFIASVTILPTALVSIPIRYMHSPVELVQLDDVQAAVRLIAAAALRLDGDTRFTR